jgi:activator of 2-hydroxyglutaryl-CoA dehydratase
MSECEQLLVGIDVGSTTTKVVVLNPQTEEIIYSNYKRHNAAQLQECSLRV